MAPGSPGKLAFGCWIFALLLCTSCGYTSKGVTVNLRARWQGTPFVLEAAEFLASESSEFYWAFLEKFSSNTPDSTTADCWSSVISVASSDLSAGLSRVLQLSLASRQHSAKLQMYRQLAHDFYANQTGCCWADVKGTVVTETGKLEAALNALLTQDGSSSGGSVAKRAIAQQMFDFDHVWPKAPLHGQPVILYAAPGTPCFSSFHKVLSASKWAEQGLRYVHRPVLTNTCQLPASSCLLRGTEEQLALPGYGVELQLKNTEYSAMDDKTPAGGSEAGSPAAAAPTEEGSLGEVNGFLFDTLVERKPHLRQELLTFRDHLLSSDEEESLKVWDLKDVGLQAAQRIGGASDPLALLSEISQNFPSIVSSLSRGKVDRKLRQSVEENQEMLSSGSNYMLINGLALDINNFDFYACLERLQMEVKLMDQLASLGIGPEDRKKLLAARAEDKTDKIEEVRLNLSPMDQITFINDLEKDDMYARFSSHISDILNTYPGRLRPLAVNAFTVVLVMDPTSTAAIEMSQLIISMWQNVYPLRFGVAFIVPSVLERARQSRRSLAAGTASSHAPLEWKEMTATEQCARAFFMMKGAFGGPAAWKFWAKFTGEMEYSSATMEHVETAFQSAWRESSRSAKSKRAKQAAKKSPADALQQLQSGTNLAAEVGTQLREHSEYLLSKGLSNLDGPHALVNGVLVPLSAQPDRQLLQRVMYEMQILQELVYYGKLTDSDPVVLDKVLELQGSVGRYNPNILAGSGEQEGEQEGGQSTGGTSTGKQHQVDLGRILSQLPSLSQRLSYLHQKGTSSSLKPVSHWVVADVGTPEGLGLLRDSVNWLLKNAAAKQARLAWLPNRAVGEEAGPSPLEVLLQLLIERGNGDIQKLLSSGDLVSRLSARASTADAASEVLNSALSMLESDGVDVADLRLKAQAELSALYGKAEHKEAWPYDEAAVACRLLGIAPGAAAVVTNGRLLLSHDPSSQDASTQDIDAEDLGLLQLLAVKYQPALKISKLLSNALTKGRLAALDGQEMTVKQASDMAMVVAAAFGAAKYPGTNMPTAASRQLQDFMGQLSGEAVQVGSKDGQSGGLEIVAILNPLTRTAQRLSAVLSWLKVALNPSIALYLNPQRDVTELPLKSFYRFVLPELQDGPDGILQLVGPPQGYFSRLPQKRVLTLGLEVPEAWLVEPTDSVYDMDNLRLVDAKERLVQADYELEALMLTGSCYDTTGARERPPRGLQLHLGAAGRPHITDTLVMANLGYFQLQAAPGLFTLTLAPGRSRQLYRLVSSTGTQDQDVDPGQDSGDTLTDITTQVIINKFTGKHMYLRVKKRPGMEQEELLGKSEVENTSFEEDDEYVDDEEDDTKTKSSGIWGSLTSFFGSKPEQANNDVINVFTIASGHMYERLQKIMMLSVIKNTKSRVKFWLIKNYMSPSHKRIIPEMAKRYGFDVAFVTYKWPQWLHKQTDKQRLIWAYKILFLDVLFPLSTPRIIFVDSDQVVRADLKELYDMNLKGAPYAYTPFCDNNKEMDEFRFWKGGFWRDHLQGKPYHISALYLVDLKRFRQLAAGDQLRVVYDMLSKDPNSLANLDQDLPNYAQHNIPIFSLPQEWLWCESWCGNSTKAKAKTIDLCNNPRTKEPKLSAARRIVTEWPNLDEEVANFTGEIEATLAQQEESMAAAETLSAEEDVGISRDGVVGEEDVEINPESVAFSDGEVAVEHSDVVEEGHGCDGEMCSIDFGEESEGHDSSEL